MRSRIDNGMRLAEKAARSMNEDDIRSLRNQYREYLRHGIIDSEEDVDLLLLAFELSAAVISADEGVRIWIKTIELLLCIKGIRHLFYTILQFIEPTDSRECGDLSIPDNYRTPLFSLFNPL